MKDYHKIGLIVAMSKEFDLVKHVLEEAQEVLMGEYSFCIGKLDDKEIVLLKSGIGKVNAAMASMEMTINFQPDCIINTGVAGGIDQSLKVGDIVVGKETCYHDFYAGEVADHQAELGFPAKIEADEFLLTEMTSLSKLNKNVHLGLICTGDQFITSNDELLKIKANHSSALAVDMESNSIAHVCNRYKVPFLSFRIISDTPWVKDHATQYENFWEEAPKQSFMLLKELLTA